MFNPRPYAPIYNHCTFNVGGEDGVVKGAQAETFGDEGQVGCYM